MKKIFSYSICLIILFVKVGIAEGFAQNLVPNPGFEINSQCPHNVAEIVFAVPWLAVIVLIILMSVLLFCKM